MSRVRANKITNKDASGAPLFTHGANITGVATATKFVGNVEGTLPATIGTGVTVTAAGIVSATSYYATTYYGSGANLTGIDATALKDSGGNVKVQANSSGAVLTGILTATSLEGDGAKLTGLPAGWNWVDGSLF